MTDGKGKSNGLLKRLSAPAALSVTLGLLYLSMKALSPPWMDGGGQTYLLAALVFSAGIVLVRASSWVLFDIIFQKRKGREASQLLRLVFSALGFAAVFVVIYTAVLQKSLSGVMATSAVLTVILGLALQDTLGNFFAGISLHIEEPYQIGDALRIGVVLGRVESVTWRTTAVRTNDNSLVVFPNSRMARDAVEIYPLHAQNRHIMQFPAPYIHRPEKVIGMIREAVASLPRVSSERTPVVRISAFADSSITYEILYWVTDYLWTSELDAEIRKRIWYIFLRNGLEIPFPVRHVLLERREGAVAKEHRDFTKFLSEVEILKPLSPEELSEVAGSLAFHIFAPGEFVLRKGTGGDSMFVIHHGRVEVLVNDADGQVQQVAVLGKGGVLGEMGLFTGEARGADVRALDELEILEIRKPVMKHLLSRNEGLAHAFSHIISGRQAELEEHARHRSAEAPNFRSESVLQRIKHFFNLA